ncbi:acyl-CoA thioesterase [Planctomicrobium sp. SH668]|uniref:acyl-CoA thioesterase n=1 Tax=Planctomicrobium sp. SH668 TaxID=3448126 RepID=UPI003F5C3B53
MAIYFDFEVTVVPADIDGLGHANNTVYFRWMQDAAVAHSSLQRWPTERYELHGWAWFVRSHHIEYRRPALLGNVLRIRTWVSEMTKFTSRRKFEFFCGNQLIARAETYWAFVDTRSGRLQAIPNEVSSSFELPAENGGRANADEARTAPSDDGTAM